MTHVLAALWPVISVIYCFRHLAGDKVNQWHLVC